MSQWQIDKISKSTPFAVGWQFESKKTSQLPFLVNFFSKSAKKDTLLAALC